MYASAAAGPDALAGEPSVLVSREAVSDGSLVAVLGAIVALCNTTTLQPLCTTWTMATAFPEPRPTDGETALSPGMRGSLIHLGNTYPQVMDGWMGLLVGILVWSYVVLSNDRGAAPRAMILLFCKAGFTTLFASCLSPK